MREQETRQISVQSAKSWSSTQVTYYFSFLPFRVLYGKTFLFLIHCGMVPWDINETCQPSLEDIKVIEKTECHNQCIQLETSRRTVIRSSIVWIWLRVLMKMISFIWIWLILFDIRGWCSRNRFLKNMRNKLEQMAIIYQVTHGWDEQMKICDLSDHTKSFKSVIFFKSGEWMQ